MITKIRKKIILTVAIFTTIIILANILQAHKISFFPLKTEDISQNNSDDIPHEKFPVNIKDMEEESFIHTINGKKYLAEHITQDDIEEMKTQSDLRNSSKNYNQIIDDHGTGLAPPTEEAYDNLIGKISIKEVISETVKSASIASSVDLSSEIYFPSVGDQGHQGSCTSWGNVYYAYGYMEAKDNGWDAKSGNPEYLLSPAWTYNKLATDRMTGSNPIQTAELMTEWGVATLNTMPYDDSDADSWGDESAWREAPYHRPLNYSLIEYKGDPTINVIKSLLNDKIPVTFCIVSSGYFHGLNDTTGDYILTSREYILGDLNHVNCIVGYDDSITEGNEVGAFRVVNSWGDDWMDGGFYWLTYEAFKELANYSWQEIIFYEDRIDYEPSLIATWEFSSTPTRMNNNIILGVGPHDVPLDMIRPNYGYDGFHLFPPFMAFDISEFQSYYESNNNVNFYLEIGQSEKSGTISSFIIERYVYGELQEITQHSFNVPKTTPGYVNTLFFLYVENKIYIDNSDLNCNWEWASMQDWCDGTGTKDDPYVIQALIIDDSSSENSTSIRNSNVYFRIENCKIFKSSLGGNVGILLVNTTNGKIINNDCSKHKNGIRIMNSHDNTISGNTVQNNDFGIIIEGNSDNNTVQGNYANNNEKYGIYLSDSDDNTVSGNNANNNDFGIGIAGNSDNNTVLGNNANYNEKYGIYLSDSDDNTVLENTVKSNDYGIHLVNGNNNVFYQNYFIGNNLNAQDSGTNIIWDNGVVGNYWDDYLGNDNNNDNIGDTPYNKNGVIDNYPIFWNDGQHGRKLYIDDHSWNNWELADILLCFSGSGTENDPYIIEDFIINADGSGSCILIENSFAYYKIENCKLYNSGFGENDAGLKLNRTFNGKIINNNCSYNNNYGIYLGFSDNTIISGNTVQNNNFGIYIRDSSDNNTVRENNVNYNEKVGIFLSFSDDNTISGNDVKYNDEGIIVALCIENIVRGNNVFHNKKYGIRLVQCSYNTILENIIKNNDIGIYVFVSHYINLLYQNSFINNTLHAKDIGIGTRWDNGAIGNYWDDYINKYPDADNDGIIWDICYEISPILFDHYPLVRSYKSPIQIDELGGGDYTWEEARTHYWCSGSGTEDDPYVIKDLIIDGGGSGSCITIKNSNAYFRIENCKVYNSGFGGKDAGIKLINTHNGEIINNDISQNHYGIWLKNSNENILSENVLREDFWSLILDSSENIVTENTFNDNYISIIILGTSSYNTFHSNFFYRSSYSHVYYLYYSYSGTGNSWDNGVVGNYWDDYIGVDYDDNGIGDTPYVIDIDNIDNYPLWEDGPIHIDELGGGGYTWEEARTHYWCSGSGTEDDPYVIKDLIIDGSGSGTGIKIENSNAYFRIENCNVYNSGVGIHLVNINNGTIINDDCSDNNQYGIYLYDCDNIIISGNTANNNPIGITLYDCDNIIISGNTANNNNAGIFLYGSDDNNISGNTANHNIYQGILFSYSGNNEVSENNASYNARYGIFLQLNSWENYGTGNYLHSNELAPIYFNVNSGPVDWIEYTE